MALLVSLIFLLVLSIIGLTAVRGTTQQEKMAAANMQQTLVFQGAEAGLRQVLGELQGRPGVPVPDGVTEPVELLVLANGLGENPAEEDKPSRDINFEDGTELSGTATVEYLGRMNCADSEFSESGQGKCGEYEVEAVSLQEGVEATATNRMGVGFYQPED